AQLPEGATLIATSERCPIAGYVIGDQVLCLQGHPEFVAGYSAALMTMRHETLGEQVFNEGMGSLAVPTSERIVAQWIMQFLQVKAR
ncbi:MAG: amidotransferase, partial [Proteobacteria bacterium]|nr:amidotransferase [Pseudomonadota bacterium]